MPKETFGRKRYLLSSDGSPRPSTSKPRAVSSASSADPGSNGCGVLRTQNSRGGKLDLVITSTTAIWIGRRDDCGFVVSSPFVSRRHLKVFAIRNEADDALVCIEDVSPSNGIRLNGLKPRTKSIFVDDGDVIELPNTGRTFTYIRDPKSKPKASRAETMPIKELTSMSWSEIERRVQKHRTIGQYNIDLEKKLGSGTFGEVYIAWDSLHEVQVACKIVSKEKLKPSDVERLNTELEIGGNLHHPNLNTVVRHLERDKAHHIFLKLATGGDAFSYVSKYNGLEQSETKYLLYQVLKGVKFMHEQGSAHRDLKLENVLLKAGGSYPTLLICDFGLATPLPASAEGYYPASPAQPFPSPPNDLPVVKKRIPAIRSPSLVGTVTYFPPEYLLGLKRQKHSQRSSASGQRGRKRAGDLLDATAMDAWAIGIMAYIMATGTHPFGSEDDTEPEVKEDEHGADEDVRPAIPSTQYDPESGLELTPFEAAVCQANPVFHPTVWSSWDIAAVDLINGLLEPDVSRRLTVSEALDHAWFEMDREALENLYRVRVIEKSVDAYGSPRRGTTAA